MNLTDEQAYITNNIRMNDMDIIAIIAYAGAGKTFILQQITQMFPHMRFLYLAYNKSIAAEAQGKFGNNVVCKTTHSLAYARFGAPIRHKLSKKMRKTDYKNWLMNSRNSLQVCMSRYNAWNMTNVVIETLNNFLYSDSDTVEADMVPNFRFSKVSDDTSKGMVCRATKELFDAMCDPDDKIGAEHDVYLKKYQLSKPELNYDAICLDEGQDSNPATRDIFLRQKCCRILVGDPYQSIYGFRGGVNAFDHVEPTQTFYLTTSFRFGPKVAEQATRTLKMFCGADKPVNSLDREDRVSYDPQEALRNKCTVLARTNATLFDKACSYVDKPMYSFGFQGGVDQEKMRDILDVYHLRARDKDMIYNSFFKTYDDFSGLQAYAMAAEDQEVIALCSIVAKYGDRIPDLVAKVIAQARTDGTQRFHLCTAHKSKGLEWPAVVLCEDFVTALEREGIPAPEEARLLYVAQTRAEKLLCMHPDLGRFLDQQEAIYAQETGETV